MEGMKTLKFVKNIRGSIRIEFKTPYPERILNICAQNGILFWGVEKIDENCFRASLFSRGLKKLRPMAEKNGCQITEISKNGAPFFIKRFRRRYALIAGFILFLAVAGAVNQYVWDFEVEGNQTISDDIILRNLSEIGIKIGVKGADISIPSVRNEMLLRLDRLEWISINVSGGRATVIVRERRAMPEMISQKGPSNIIAQKAGIIVEMNTMAGSAQVQAGQTVKEGQLLVSGIVDIPNSASRYVYSLAEIKARTWRDVSVVMPLEASSKTYTGKVKTRNALIFAGKRINLYKEGGAPYGFCDKIEKTGVLRLPMDVIFPIKLVTEQFLEYTCDDTLISEAEAESQVKSVCERYLENSIKNGEVTDSLITTESAGKAFKANLLAECVEDIALVVDLPVLGGDGVTVDGGG